MNRWFLDENDIGIYLKCTDDVRWHYNKKELVRILNDLEAKLAESEKKAYSRGHSQRDIDNEIKLNALREDVSNKEKRIVELKQQLAEKEKEKNKEIENIKLCRCVNCKNEYEFMLEGLVEDLEKQIDKDDQDKILFAVEQLEKVLKTLEEKQFFKKEDTAYCVHPVQIAEYIDNQIKQLKEGK